MTKKNNIASFLSFTFLVWVRSVLVIVIGIGIGALFLVDQLISNFELSYIAGAFGFALVAYIYTIPGFIIMLLAVYLINRTRLKVVEQKLLIFFTYTLPFLFFVFLGDLNDIEEVLMCSFLLLVPAIMIYLTPLLPYNQFSSTKEERDDLIDDINFEE